jgi:cytochrome c oxidase subunit 2
VALAVLASGCGGDQSATAPDSTATHEISDLWWAMLGMGVVVFLGTAVFLVGGWVRRHKEGLPIFGQDEKASTWLVVAFGIVIPILVLVPVFVAANLFITEKTSAPAKASTPMTIQVIGHQWWWEVRYPGTTAVTANEIHIPTNTRIDMIATTADVIHSFWVPRINRRST